MRDFNHTIGILVNAYIKDELKRGTCSACAVTNILGNSIWNRLFVTMNHYGTPIPQVKANEGEIINWTGERILCTHPWEEAKRNEAVKLVNDSGYTIDELARVENAFETSSREGDAMFNGLMSVVDVLADIHGIDLTEKESAKALFVKA